jgi:hypothetical protein
LVFLAGLLADDTQLSEYGMPRRELQPKTAKRRFADGPFFPFFRQNRQRRRYRVNVLDQRLLSATGRAIIAENTTEESHAPDA